MAKIWSLAFALLVGAGVWAAPAVAQSNDVGDDVGKIERMGGSHSASTTLGGDGLSYTSEGFSMRVHNQVQFRLTHQQEVANGEDGTNGRNFTNFRIPRAKTTFAGHIYDRNWQYEVRLGWTNGGNDIVEVARFRYAMMQHFNLNAGQDKVAFGWEYPTDSSVQTFVERGAVSQIFNQGYGKGVWFDGMIGDDVPLLLYTFGIYNGVLAGDNDFRNMDRSIRAESYADGSVDNSMMVNLRLETHPMGAVERRMNDNRGTDESDKMLIALGLSLNYFQTGAATDLRPASTTGTGKSRTRADTVMVGLDAHFRYMGLSVDLELFYRQTDFRNRGSLEGVTAGGSRSYIGDLTDAGMALEVAYFVIPSDVSLGLRVGLYDADKFWGFGGNPDSQSSGIRPETVEVGVAANYYLQGDRLKLTADISHVAQRLAEPVPGAGGLLGVYNDPPAPSGGNSSDYNNLWIIRLQLQWLF
jgi:phosphate-selective porin OprO and OprP